MLKLCSLASHVPTSAQEIFLSGLLISNLNHGNGYSRKKHFFLLDVTRHIELYMKLLGDTDHFLGLLLL